jgi:SNF2 family DNA or RNA helicase
MKIVGHELGKNYKKFLDEYTIKTVGRFSKITGGKNLQDLYVKLSNFMVRKTKAECLDLPEKIYLSYKYQLDDYRDEYDRVVNELNTQKEHAALSGSLHSLNIITARAKIKGVIELAEEIIEQGRKVVIFSGYKVPLKLLEDHFGSRSVTVDGSIDAFTRDKNIQRFWNDESCEVFLANMQAGGVGINLTCASDVIFTNFPFTPPELWQAEDRLHRIGQGNSVNVHYTVCEDSIDEYIYDIILDKAKDIHALVDQGRQVSVSDGNITELLISKLLKRDAKLDEDTIVESNDIVDSVVVEKQPEATKVELKEEITSNSLILPDWML